MSLERVDLWKPSGVVEAYKSFSRIKYAKWLSMSQFEKGGVIERMGINNMILKGDSFGLCVYYINNLECYLT